MKFVEESFLEGKGSRIGLFLPIDFGRKSLPVVNSFSRTLHAFGPYRHVIIQNRIGLLTIFLKVITAINLNGGCCNRGIDIQRLL